MKSKNNYLLFVVLLIPIFLAFRALFYPGPLAWGDAPYFHPEYLRSLLAEPLVWNGWNSNFGGVSTAFWLAPLMFLFGLLHSVFVLDSFLLFRIVFYFPAVVFSLVGPILLARYLGLSQVVQFFASLVYTLNTYFILLVDGGQVGVALAYGLFPLTILFLRKLVDYPTLGQFYATLVVFIFAVITDIRFAAIALFSFLVWVAFRPTNLKILIPFLVAVLGLSFWWLVPLVRLVPGGGIELGNSPATTWLHALTLFQPHWPTNEFGKVSPPPFYFVGVPLLVFAGLLTRKKQMFIFTICFLLFAFLTKGVSPPVGGVYVWLVENIPFGSAFRDSTKFFSPTVLFAGLLVGSTVEHLKNLADGRVKGGHWAVLTVVFGYLLLLVYPALFGQLNGVLTGRRMEGNIPEVNEQVAKESGSFRVAWFPERHPWSFHTEEKPLLDAKDLIEFRPFASMNTGTFDAFNFVHNDRAKDWFQLLGVKYLVFSGDARKVRLSQEEKEDWERLLQLVDSKSWLTKVASGDIPVYKIADTKPKILAVDKAVFVVGSDDIYKKLWEQNKDFDLGKRVFIFLEDGGVDPNLFENFAPGSAVLVFNDKDETDLAMSFLQKYFISPVDATKGIEGPSQWALRSPSDYLKWKYEFLINGVDTREFDYDKGVAFSSVAGEWIYFDISVPEDGEYVFAARVLTRDKSEPLELNPFYSVPVPFTREGKFEWYVREGLSLQKGTQRVAIKNVEGFHAVNVVALVPRRGWDQAKSEARSLVEKFKVDNLDISSFSDWQEVEYKQTSPVRYKLSLTGRRFWIVFTDSYHPKWSIIKDRIETPVYPAYSAVNAFYLEHAWDKADIVFTGQKDVRWGMYYTAVTALILAIVGLFVKVKNEKNL